MWQHTPPLLEGNRVKLNFLAYTFDNRDGYGRHARLLMRGLYRRGVDVTPLSSDMLDWDSWMLRLTSVDFSRLTIGIMSASAFRGLPGRQWGISMFESTKLPDDYKDAIVNHLERLIVPCEWNAEVFRANGIPARIPIHVVGEGIDPHEFPYVERRSGHRPFTFLALGDRGMRKGDDLVWTAFFRAFDVKKDDVRLVLKARAGNHLGMDLTRNPKWLSLWREDVASMSDVYHAADCFVFPTRGEGWGLPAREAAATGMPVIATRFGGTAVDIDRWGIPIEQYAMVPATIGGEWAEPNLDELIEKMRWVYEHQDEALAVGRNASAWLHANQTWEHAADDLIALMEQWV